MAEIVWTAEALRWLHEIHDHIAADSADAADRVVKGILAHVEQLVQFPESGALLRALGQTFRMMLYEHYRIVYRLLDGERIEVIGVYHGPLDIARRLMSDVKGTGGDTIHE